MPAPSKARRIGVPLAALVALLVVWELLVDLGVVPNFLLPTPVQVAAMTAAVRSRWRGSGTTDGPNSAAKRSASSSETS